MNQKPRISRKEILFVLAQPSVFAAAMIAFNNAEGQHAFNQLGRPSPSSSLTAEQDALLMKSASDTANKVHEMAISLGLMVAAQELNIPESEKDALAMLFEADGVTKTAMGLEFVEKSKVKVKELMDAVQMEMLKEMMGSDKGGIGSLIAGLAQAVGGKPHGLTTLG